MTTFIPPDAVPDAKKDTLFKKASFLLQRRDQPIEEESWALEYVNRMASSVLYAREALEAWYDAEKNALQQNQSWMGRMLSGAGVFDSAASKALLEEYQKQEAFLNEQEAILRARYQIKSRSFEGTYKAKAYLRAIPGFSELSETDKNDFQKKLGKIEIQHLENLDKGEVSPDQLLEKEVEAEVKIAIEKAVSETYEPVFQLELKRIKNIQKIDPEIRLRLIQDFRKNFIEKMILIDHVKETNETASKVDNQKNMVSKNLQEAEKRIQAAIYCSEFSLKEKPSLKESFDHIKYVTPRYSEWQKNAEEKMDSIPGAGKVDAPKRQAFLNKMIHIEEQYSHYRESVQNASFIQKGLDAILNTEFGDNVYGRIVKQEKENIKAIQASINAAYEGIVEADLRSYLNAAKDFEDCSPHLREMLKHDLKSAILNKHKSKDNLPVVPGSPELKRVLKEIEVAIRFAKAPIFQKPESAQKQKRMIENLAADLIELNQNREQKRHLQEEEKTALERKESDLIEGIKAQLADISREEFLEEDAEFAVEENKLSDFWKETKEGLKAYFKRPEIQSAFTMADLMGGAIGAILPLYGTVSGALIGAVLGYKKPEAGKLLSPLKYLISEIKDIAQKPKSYIDRAFRGGMILGTLGLVVYGLALGGLAIGLSNPFSAAALLGIAVAAVVTSKVAKMAKWISKKMSEKFYGISNSDRYELSPEAKKLFNADIGHEIRKLFVHEIRDCQKVLEKISDKSSHQAWLYSRKLVELESTWDKIQLGNNESLKAWKDCSRALYLEKKREYQNHQASEIHQHAHAVLDSLMQTPSLGTVPDQTLKSGAAKKVAKEKKVQPKENNIEALNFLYMPKRNHHQLEKARQEIHKIKELNRKIPKPQ